MMDSFIQELMLDDVSICDHWIALEPESTYTT